MNLRIEDTRNGYVIYADEGTYVIEEKGRIPKDVDPVQEQEYLDQKAMYELLNLVKDLLGTFSSKHNKYNSD